jgi:hypothetical protein
MQTQEQTQEPGANDIVIATVEVDPDVKISDNAENTEGDTSTINESGNEEQKEIVQDAPAIEQEVLEIDFDAVYGETGGESSEAPAVKPLEFVDKLPTEDQQAYLQQVTGLNKLVVRDAQYREVAGTHDVEVIQRQIATGRDFMVMAQKITNPVTQEEAIAEFLEEIEEITGKSLEEIAPERFGWQVPQEQLELMGRERRLAQMEERQASQQQQSQWIASPEAKALQTAFKKQTGFTLDPARVAQYVIAGDSPIDMVRKAHPKEWEKHLFELGKKSGLKESRAKETTDLPVDRKSVSGVQYYESGPFKGQVKPR